MSNRDSSGGGWFVYDASSDSYDLNTRILATAVIFLAAVVVFIIVLHIYVHRMFFRRRRGNNLAASAASGSRLLRFYVNDPAHDDHVAAPGLDPSAIAALLARPYRSTEGGDGECAICLSAVEDAEMVRVLPGCGHLFHVGCIDMWLGSQCTCPVCRAAVEPPSATAAAADCGEATTPASQEEASLGAKESESARILSWERSMARRPQGQGMEDLERQ